MKRNATGVVSHFPIKWIQEVRERRAETRRLRHERLVQRGEEIISAAQSAALQSFEEGLPDVPGCGGTSPGTPA